ncbi:hypothetical protein GR702_18360 [Novosphingobium sp. FGD1]|uniref:Uncharacterized protein n=1 Tax=Novosphingobium silvae TaxID=2692619 RepID=A0A7X4GK36_9SPHN|nr:hypothetical protein [Novosphingobium silvae]MYL99725.1 hypothetical protein [Novosphingobium silvae]
MAGIIEYTAIQVAFDYEPYEIGKGSVLVGSDRVEPVKIVFVEPYGSLGTSHFETILSNEGMVGFCGKRSFAIRNPYG